VRPGRVLARGAGEQVTALPDPPRFGVLVLPSAATLSTAAVYAQAERMGLPRTLESLESLDPLESLGVNDLEAAACALEPSIERALAAARDAGAARAMVCGSGPTVIGFYDEPAAAAAAAARLRAVGLVALAARPFPRSATWV